MKELSKKSNRYHALLEGVFSGKYKEGMTEVAFSREEIEPLANRLKIDLPKNIGDIIYSVRYRTELPAEILKTQPDGMEWIIKGKGRPQYCFKLVKINRILPNRELTSIKIPDATPEIIGAYSLSDEQALLAKVRYNRLLDIFLGVAAYSMQNHLRTSVFGIGQVEIDEIYVGVDKRGCHYILPVQAKGGQDQLSAVQTKQDIACCREKFPNLICRPISAQFIEDDLMALFELTSDGDGIRIVDEKHYKLVSSDEITAGDLDAYARRPN